MADRFLSKLSQNFLEILDDDEYYDITIEVGNDPHKNDETLIHIKLPNILPEIFQIILRYIYGGKISLMEYDTLDIIKILVAANELSLQELIPYLQSFLIENKENWIEQNFNLVYQTSFENDSFLDLQKFCTELISKQPEKIFNSPDFTSISEKILISLIQLDDRKINEVQIWENVLKWGIAQNPGLSSDPSNYSNDDFITLKNILQQFIPFIKFTDFTSKEFVSKVFPYRKIIPEDLQDNLIKYFLDHDHSKSNKKSEQQQTIKTIKKIDSNNNNNKNKKSIDSKIITNQHVELISKWIDKLEITDELKNLYEFKLILRGSRDGFTPEKFHEFCDNQSNTISIIKLKDSNEILGGYNPIMWQFKIYNIYSETKDSFIFSFNNNNMKDIKNHILSRVKNKKYAIDNNFIHGPSFGQEDLQIYGGSKRSFNDRTSHCKKISYEKQIRKTEDHFSIEEYEIFQIYK
ncbi:hypothetical protein RhiirA1_536711 [Rhizophagus irregularis]|uniref:TLDc domain-containing protein n=1 Tax=Rhizophagus irregularis TaxID=588596 RepID=A0A2N0RNP9_9GLOM|nr:hypothetical protein RhiirA1_536711 [Rhizophagus irregularis]